MNSTYTATVRETCSLCPECLKKVPARYERDADGTVRLVRRCDEHGELSAVVWRGAPELEEWQRGWEAPPESEGCPTDCGLCSAHANDTCCAILDVTERCNLSCGVCFAGAGGGRDVPFDQVYRALEDIYSQGRRYLHISGGEPTVRDDLADIVSFASGMGFEYIQINTNGLALAEDPAIARDLAEAGASCVFLQFDGITDEVYAAIRGRPLLSAKLRAIDNCDRAELGVVLVPTLMPGVNDGQVGGIIRIALDRMPAVKGVHFQPIAYTGRFPQGERLTMPELIRAIESQTGGLILAASIAPSVCDAPMCGFHAEFRRLPDGTLKALSSRASCCCGAPSASKNQSHVKNRWTRAKSGDFEPDSMDALLKELKDSSFCISAMFFQDPWTFDTARVKQCSVHVYSGGSFVPFCAYNNVRRGR